MLYLIESCEIAKKNLVSSFTVNLTSIKHTGSPFSSPNWLILLYFTKIEWLPSQLQCDSLTWRYEYHVQFLELITHIHVIIVRTALFELITDFFGHTSNSKAVNYYYALQQRRFCVPFLVSDMISSCLFHFRHITYVTTITLDCRSIQTNTNLITITVHYIIDRRELYDSSINSAFFVNVNIDPENSNATVRLCPSLSPCYCCHHYC